MRPDASTHLETGEPIDHVHANENREPEPREPDSMAAYWLGRVLGPLLLWGLIALIAQAFA